MPYGVILFRTLLAVLVGGLIGMERQKKQRPAGFRTHILVCVGASTVMILSALLAKETFEAYGVTGDPARMGAQVVSGVGFLGAGTIIHYGSNVRGLTTAASLWAVATIGLVVGSGFYALALTSTTVIYFALLIFNKISKKFERKGNILELMVELVNKPKALGNINLVLAKKNCKILDMEFFNNAYPEPENLDIPENISLRLILNLQYETKHSEIIESILEVHGVISVERA